MSVRFDKDDNAICSEHGDIGDNIGWIQCTTCFGEGQLDLYEEDAINYTEGEEFEICDECQGKGGWNVCGICCADSHDVEW